MPHTLCSLIRRRSAPPSALSVPARSGRLLDLVGCERRACSLDGIEGDAAVPRRALVFFQTGLHQRDPVRRQHRGFRRRTVLLRRRPAYDTGDEACESAWLDRRRRRRWQRRVAGPAPLPNDAQQQHRGRLDAGLRALLETLTGGVGMPVVPRVPEARRPRLVAVRVLRLVQEVVLRRLLLRATRARAARAGLTGC